MQRLPQWAQIANAETAVFNAAYAIASQGDEQTYTGPHQKAFEAGRAMGTIEAKKRV